MLFSFFVLFLSFSWTTSTWEKGHFLCFFKSLLNSPPLFWVYRGCRVPHLGVGAAVRVVFGCQVRDAEAVVTWAVDSRVTDSAQGQLVHLPAVRTLWYVSNDGVGETRHHNVVWKKAQSERQTRIWWHACFRRSPYLFAVRCITGDHDNTRQYELCVVAFSLCNVRWTHGFIYL